MADFVWATLRKWLEGREIKISFLLRNPLREMNQEVRRGFHHGEH
jgi:hypothetical protein